MDIDQGEPPLSGTHEAQIIARICKSAAVKAGQVLSQAEMQEMVRQLEACAAPRTCPHGRPTMIHLTTAQLARQFGRLG
jgi:DNA mismatch repair protein MutL